MKIATLTCLLALASSTAVHALPRRQDGLVERHVHNHDMSDMDDMDGVDGMDEHDEMTPTSTMTGMAASSTFRPQDPHSHHHGSHAKAKETLNDTYIHLYHYFPPSYLAADFRLDADSAIFGEEFDSTWNPEEASGHRGLIVLHVVAMCLGYFGALPISLALRAAEHPMHYLANIVFLLITLLGWLSGVAYKAATPDRYEGAVHGGMGNILVVMPFALAGLDSLGLFKRAYDFWRGADHSWSMFVSTVLGSQHWAAKATSGDRYEMLGLMSNPYEGDNGHNVRGTRSLDTQVVFVVEDEEEQPARRSLVGSRPQRPSLLKRTWSPLESSSGHSDGTLNESPPASAEEPHHHYNKQSSQSGAYDVEREVAWEQPEEKLTAMRFGAICLTWIRRMLVVIAYVVVLTGLAMYTGMCRGSFINSCAAHYIKGSIFFGYGVLTFARYLGAYADLGWAWNRRPGKVSTPSAEMVECFVIFLYGITNTWMERFGAAPGDPYTVKQVQHISIAVMFWFAGLSGMLLESTTVRKILGSVVAGGRKDVTEPPSYTFSFNPLPALTIAVTGLAMAAHHQDYVFQVEIHSLWGILLAGGSFFRFLTYCFLFLRPPTESTLPSRPPTEVLTSFGWAAGGIVFILSDEEIMFAAMRAGYDDMMAFLNITIALTCLIFCWEVIVMTVKGVAVLRLQRGKPRQEEAGHRVDTTEHS